MSLMQALVGENPAADIILALLNLNRQQTGRFRDCYVRLATSIKTAPQNDDQFQDYEFQIVIFTRNNGLGKDELEPIHQSLIERPDFVESFIDDFDRTFISYVLSAPPEIKPLIATIYLRTKEYGTPMERFHALMRKLENPSTNKDDPDVVRVLQIGKNIFEPLKEQLENGSPAIEITIHADGTTTKKEILDVPSMRCQNPDDS